MNLHDHHDFSLAVVTNAVLHIHVLQECVALFQMSLQINSDDKILPYTHHTVAAVLFVEGCSCITAQIIPSHSICGHEKFCLLLVHALRFSTYTLVVACKSLNSLSGVSDMTQELVSLQLPLHYTAILSTSTTYVLLSVVD